MFGTVALVALGIAAPASAADLAARPYKAPPPAPVVAIYDWTGFYIGANGGYGWARQCLDITRVGFVNVFAEGCNDKGGGVVGGQIGYRWQAGSWVFGLEAQGDWANLRTERVFVNTPLLNTTNTWKSNINGLGLFTGQIGYAWNASLLLCEGRRCRRKPALRQSSIPSPASASGRQNGPVGAVPSVSRWEYGFAPNWTAGIEYDYLFRESDSHTFLTPISPIGPFTANTRSDVSMVTGRISYKYRRLWLWWSRQVLI